jgi:hypothetical protein
LLLLLVMLPELTLLLVLTLVDVLVLVFVLVLVLPTVVWLMLVTVPEFTLLVLIVLVLVDVLLVSTNVLESYVVAWAIRHADAASPASIFFIIVITPWINIYSKSSTIKAQHTTAKKKPTEVGLVVSVTRYFLP